MAYLITGGLGFVGSYVIRDLVKAGREVVSLDIAGVSPLFVEAVGEENLSKIKIIYCDISHTSEVFEIIHQNKIDTIIHLSSLLGASSAISAEAHPAYAVQANCVGMSNLLEAARLFGLKKVVWTSSGQVLGNVGQYCPEPIGDDNAIYMPDTFYSATKALCESMSKLYFERFGVDVLGLRIGFSLGIGKLQGKGNSFSQFLKNAATNKPALMAAIDLDHPRVLGYIENTSDLILKACEVPVTKTRNFNVVEYLVSCRQLADTISRVNPGARLDIKNHVQPEQQTWAGTPEPKLDTSGMEKEIGWKPKYSLEEALTRIFNYFRQKEGMPLL